MISYFETDCPGCSRRLRVRAAYVGLSIACNRCNRSFVAQPIPGRPFLEGRPPRTKDCPTGSGTTLPESAPTPVQPDLQTRATFETPDRISQSADRLAEAPTSILAERRAEEEASRRRETEELVADRDRLRGEVGELTARLMDAEAESGRWAEVAGRGDAERSRLDLLHQRLKSELDRSLSERDLLHSSLEAAEAGRDAASRELGEAALLWKAERQDLLRQIDELRANRAQAEVELDSARFLLESERSARGQECESALSREQALRAEIETLNRTAETQAALATDLALERGEVEDRLRRSVEQSEMAQARHASEVEALSRTLLDEQRQGQGRASALEAIEEQLRLTKLRLIGRARARRDERRGHRERIAEIRRDRESERSSHDAQRSVDRSKYEEVNSRQSAEIADLLSEVDYLRGESAALRGLLDDKDRELVRVREEADLLATEHAGLQRRIDELIRERELLREQASVAELTGAHGPVVSPESMPQHDLTSTIVPTSTGLAIVPGTTGPTGASPPDLILGDATGAEGQSVGRWPLPEAADIDAARDQIALLSDLLRTARQANSRLSDRLARSMGVRKGEAHASEVPTPPRPAGATERDGTDLHVGMMRRAARLARRRKWGVD